ncbi:pheST operon leader peptide PheM [Rouxiella sp. T17]
MNAATFRFFFYFSA